MRVSAAHVGPLSVAPRVIRVSVVEPSEWPKTVTVVASKCTRWNCSSKSLMTRIHRLEGRGAAVLEGLQMLRATETLTWGQGEVRNAGDTHVR